MKKGFWKTVQEVINKSDIILHVADARFPRETINKDIEFLTRRAGKKIIYIFNKSDLVRNFQTTSKPYVLVSCTTKKGIAKLKTLIKSSTKHEKPRVGVVGYPNVGKSSLSNVLKGKKSARTSPEAGYTKGMQFVSSKQFFLIDTPGVIPKKEQDKAKHVKLGLTTFKKDPEEGALLLLGQTDGEIEGFFDVPRSEDHYETLELLALKNNFILKGKKPDVMRAAKLILDKWFKGEISKSLK